MRAENAVPVWPKVEWRHASEEEERQALIPPGVSFELEGPPRVREGRWIDLSARLSYEGEGPVELVLFPVADRSPFFVRMIVSENLALKPAVGDPIPPVPPRGRVMTLEPGTVIRFEESIDLNEYDIRTLDGAQLQWSFEYWADPKPSGTIELSSQLIAELQAQQGSRVR